MAVGYTSCSIYILYSTLAIHWFKHHHPVSPLWWSPVKATQVMCSIVNATKMYVINSRWRNVPFPQRCHGTVSRLILTRSVYFYLWVTRHWGSNPLPLFGWQSNLPSHYSILHRVLVALTFSQQTHCTVAFPSLRRKLLDPCEPMVTAESKVAADKKHSLSDEQHMSIRVLR